MIAQAQAPDAAYKAKWQNVKEKHDAAAGKNAIDAPHFHAWMIVIRFKFNILAML